MQAAVSKAVRNYIYQIVRTVVDVAFGHADIETRIVEVDKGHVFISVARIYH